MHVISLGLGLYVPEITKLPNSFFPFPITSNPFVMGVNSKWTLRSYTRFGITPFTKK